MKNTTEKKKINWKKVAAFGGMFVAGVVVGVVGGEKVLGEIALDGLSRLEARAVTTSSGTCVLFHMWDEKTGRELTSFVDKAGLKGAMEFLTPFMDDPTFH